MTDLLDANALIALALADHEHHDTIRSWMISAESFAVCPVTEGALLRTLVRLGESPITARRVLDGFRSHPRCHFWPDDLSYSQVDLEPLIGHRQLTDAYLVALATHHTGRLVTFDRGLCSIHTRNTVLLGSRD